MTDTELETIDTGAPQHQQSLAEVDSLRTLLAPRIAFLIELPRDKQEELVNLDPVLRHAILWAQSLREVIDLELKE